MSGLFLRRSVVVLLLPHPDSRVIPLPNRTSPVRLRSPYGLPPTHPNLSLMKRPRVAGLNSNRVARLSDAAIQCRIPTAIHKCSTWVNIRCKLLRRVGQDSVQINKLRISAMVISRFGERDRSGRWCCAVNGL